MHALAVHHEQVREDREDYLIVHEDYIEPAMLGNYKKSPVGAFTTYGVLYNYESIMHYGKWDGGFNKPQYKGKDVMEVKKGHPPALGNTDNMGQRDKITPGDVQLLNKRHNCPLPWNYEDEGPYYPEEYGVIEDCEHPDWYVPEDYYPGPGGGGGGGPPDGWGCDIVCTQYCPKAIE